MRSSRFKTLTAASLTILLAACAGAPDDGIPVTYGPENTEDPFESFNRGVYKFNRALDRKVLDPFVGGYKAVVPSVARKRLSNAVRNLNEPLNAAHNILQGKPDRAARSVARFFINSLWGLGGLFDVAKHADVEWAPEDAGQTLAVWGVPTGPYLQLPFFGPSTLRDTVGLGIDSVADPFGYIVGGQFGVEVFDNDFARPAVAAGSAIQLRTDFDDQADQLYELDVDEGYNFARTGYLQSRCAAAADNDPAACEQDDLFDDEFVSVEPLTLPPLAQEVEQAAMSGE